MRAIDLLFPGHAQQPYPLKPDRWVNRLGRQRQFLFRSEGKYHDDLTLLDESRIRDDD
jgi:hypothetical protein